MGGGGRIGWDGESEVGYGSWSKRVNENSACR